MKVPFLDIIIVNWNTGRQLRDCLMSIVNANKRGIRLERVIVVDNASSDGSVEGFGDLDLPLTIIRNSENRGFAAACNQGAKSSQADYLLFLNPDTRLFPDSLAKPLAFMEMPENCQVGICGIQLTDDYGNISQTCARFPTTDRFFSKMLGLDKLVPKRFLSHFMTDWDHLENREVDQVMGAFFLVRRLVFKEFRGFDERFFVYFEEVDLSYRARKAGWLSFYLAEAQAYHKGGGTSEQVKAMRLFYSLRSRILYGYKHFGIGAATGLMAITLLVEPISRLMFALVRGQISQISETLIAYLMLWRDLFGLLRHKGARRLER